MLYCPCATPVTSLRRLLRKLDRPPTAPRPPELDPSDSSSRPTVLLLANESEIVRRTTPSEDRRRSTRLVSAVGWAASGTRAVGESGGATGPSGRRRRTERTRAVFERYVVLLKHQPRLLQSGLISTLFLFCLVTDGRELRPRRASPQVVGRTSDRQPARRPGGREGEPEGRLKLGQGRLEVSRYVTLTLRARHRSS